jgi:hypothetical protein
MSFASEWFRSALTAPSFEKFSLVCQNNSPQALIADSSSKTQSAFHQSPVGIDSCNTAPTPTGFPEFVGYDFPVLHSIASILIIG